MQAALDGTTQETEMMRVQAAALGVSTDAFDAQTYALEFATKQQELLNIAKRDGTAATPQEVAQIKAVADAYAQQKAQITGVEEAANAAETARRDQQAALVESAQALSQAGLSFASTFIGALREGKSVAEALQAALDNLIDTLFYEALQSLFRRRT